MYEAQVATCYLDCLYSIPHGCDQNETSRVLGQLSTLFVSGSTEHGYHQGTARLAGEDETAAAAKTLADLDQGSLDEDLKKTLLLPDSSASSRRCE